MLALLHTKTKSVFFQLIFSQAFKAIPHLMLPLSWPCEFERTFEDFAMGEMKPSQSWLPNLSIHFLHCIEIDLGGIPKD